MDYLVAFIVLFAAFVLYRISAWVFGTVVKLAFLAGFVALGVLAMSSTVGLL